MTNTPEWICDWCGLPHLPDEEVPTEVDFVELRPLDDVRFIGMKGPWNLHENCLDDIFETDTVEVFMRLKAP